MVKSGGRYSDSVMGW